MAEQDMADEDLFADLYNNDEVEPTATAVQAEPEPSQPESGGKPADHEPVQAPLNHDIDEHVQDSGAILSDKPDDGGYGDVTQTHSEDDRPIYHKDDGKMFIGGLNWETTDESLKNYFTQFGEVIECTVMRDGATGRSRGFGFLTFKDPKNVNLVMVKEHTLDGKLIDPKRAIPRDEQERTAKIFVGGVSQECDQETFKNFFKQFGNVLDATLMMDKETGRPRGFGFVTFDSETAVDRTLEGPLAICDKPIEIKRAQPRGDMREQESTRGGKFGRHGKQEQFNGGGSFSNTQSSQTGGEAQNNMSPAMMAAYWQRMQQYFSMMQQQMAANNMGGMNPMAAMQNSPQMMQQMTAHQGMNPAMMQQMMANMQQGGYPGIPQNGGGSPLNGPMASQSPYSGQEQNVFEQKKYEMQQRARMQGGQFNGGSTWEGMYDDVPAPAGLQSGNMQGGNMQGGNMQGGNVQGGNVRGGFGGRGRGGRASGTPQPASQAPAGAPTGPKNAGRPGANYRGGGRGGHRGFHPYARGGG